MDSLQEVLVSLVPNYGPSVFHQCWAEEKDQASQSGGDAPPSES